MSKAASKSKSSTRATADEQEKISLRKRLLRQEGALIGWIVLCAYLMLAFSSYSKDDASFSYTGSVEGITSNAAGPAGAWLADIFFSLSGYVAYLFPLLLAVRAWNVFQGKYHKMTFH